MALVLLSPLNTLATHGSSVASSWISTGLTFSFPPKPPLTQNPSFTDIHGPHPTAQLPAVNPIPLHSEESDRTTREAGERESAGTPRPPRFVEAAVFEARAHPPLLPPAARPRLSGPRSSWAERKDGLCVDGPCEEEVCSLKRSLPQPGLGDSV